MIARLLDRFVRRLPMRIDRLAAWFARNIDDTTCYAVAFVALGGIAECDSYEVEIKGVDGGVVRFAVDHECRSGDARRVLSTLGFPTEAVEIPLRDGDSVRSVIEMAVALVHFRVKPDDLAAIGEIASDHPLALAHRAVEARLAAPRLPTERRGGSGQDALS